MQHYEVVAVVIQEPLIDMGLGCDQHTSLCQHVHAARKLVCESRV